jgi:recombination protein RecT
MGSALATRRASSIAAKLQDENVLAKLKQVAPRAIGLERFTRIALAEIMGNSALAECTDQSLLSSIMQACKLGLEPGILGRCYLVPFREKGVRKCQLIVGYQGMLDLARRSGELSSVQANAVRAGDVFEYELGLEPRLKHVPDVNRTEFGDEQITHFYAVAKLKDGGAQMAVMGRAQVDAIRKRSAAANRGPWVTDYEPMGCKTVLKRVLKLCPASVELQEAISLDDAADIGRIQPTQPEFVEADDIAPPSDPDDALADKIAGNDTPKEQPAEAAESPSNERAPENAQEPEPDESAQEKLAGDVYAKLKVMGPVVRRADLLSKYGIEPPIKPGDLKALSMSDLQVLLAELNQ